MSCIDHGQKGGTHGHGKLSFNGKSVGAHVKAYCLAHGLDSIPSGMVVRHTCDNGRCINPEHLILGTQKQNIQDAVERNRIARGTRQGRSKLSDEQVIQIRDLIPTMSQRALAARFGVSQRTILNIKQGVIWTHVT